MKPSPRVEMKPSLGGEKRRRCCHAQQWLYPATFGGRLVSELQLEASHRLLLSSSLVSYDSYLIYLYSPSLLSSPPLASPLLSLPALSQSLRWRRSTALAARGWARGRGCERGACTLAASHDHVASTQLLDTKPPTNHHMCRRPGSAGSGGASGGPAGAKRACRAGALLRCCQGHPPIQSSKPPPPRPPNRPQTAVCSKSHCARRRCRWRWGWWRRRR